MRLSEDWCIVEWWDTAQGAWCDLGEARTLEAGQRRIAGLQAADSEPQKYRIVQTRIYV